MHRNEQIKELSLLIDNFISGKNFSLIIAGKIEVTLDTLFPEDEEIQDYVTCFAMYRPEGGEFLYNFNDMVLKCNELLDILQSKI